MRTLRATILEHVSAVCGVGIALLLLVVLIRGVRPAPDAQPEGLIRRSLAIDSLDWGDPLHRALFRDALRVLHPAPEQVIDSIMNAIEDARLAQYADPNRKLGGARRVLDWSSVMEMTPMYLMFLASFFAVMFLTYIAARAIAVWKFIVWKQQCWSYLRSYAAAVESGGSRQAVARVDLLVKAIVKGFLSLLLFSPAYVIAYSLRTRIDTESMLFLIPLAIVSNGILIDHANRFFTLLVAESRKGYVSMAIVKGVAGSYAWGTGLPRSVLLLPVLRSEGHVFRDIFRNARLQFLPATKEHAAFIVTGLVIIEMALNIKGHLCYALLQHILYREFDIAIAMVFGIYLAVKLTEACIDVWHARELRKYDNEA